MIQSAYILSLRETMTEYDGKCSERIQYHHKNAKASKLWDNFLSFNGLFLSASTALSMTIMTALEVDSIPITIIGSIYAFLLTINNKVKDDYRFVALHYQHVRASDDYAELQVCVKNLLAKIDHNVNFESADLERVINKYESIKQNSHFQEVKDCNFFCCLK